MSMNICILHSNALSLITPYRDFKQTHIDLTEINKTIWLIICGSYHVAKS